MRTAVMAAVLAFSPRLRGPAPLFARHVGQLVLQYLDRRRGQIDRDSVRE